MVTIMTTDMTNFEIKVGDKVIRKDGLVGKIIERILVDNEEIFTAEYDNGERELVHHNTYGNFYLIGHTVLGNKINEIELQKQLDIQKAKAEIEQNKYDQLRKQMWYLKNRMVDNWQERKAKAEKEKQERTTKKRGNITLNGEKDDRSTKDKNKTEKP